MWKLNIMLCISGVEPYTMIATAINMDTGYRLKIFSYHQESGVSRYTVVHRGHFLGIGEDVRYAHTMRALSC